MPRYKITVVEVLDPTKVVYDEQDRARAVTSVPVFEQSFDDLNLRDLVLKLNAQPRRKRRAKQEAAA